MNKCPHCGADLQENASFCLHCMTPLTEKKNIAVSDKPRRRTVWLTLSSAVAVIALVLALLLWPQGKPLSPDIGGEQTTTSVSTSTTSYIVPSSTTSSSSLPVTVTTTTSSRITATTTQSTTSTAATNSSATSTESTTTTTTTVMEPGYRIGTVQDGVYINEWADMKLVIPDEWELSAPAESEPHCDLFLVRRGYEPKFRITITHTETDETTEECGRRVYDHWVAVCDANGWKHGAFDRFTIAGKTFRGVVITTPYDENDIRETAAVWVYVLDGVAIELYINAPNIKDSKQSELSDMINAFERI